MTVRIGAEVEFLPVKGEGGTPPELITFAKVDRKNGTKLSMAVLMSYGTKDLAVRLYGHPEKWKVGTDGANIECRTSNTECVLVEDYAEHMCTLAEYVNGPFAQISDYEQNWYTGHHVHINVRETAGPAVNRLALMCRYWDFYEQYRSLVENPKNRLEDRPYNQLLPTNNKTLFMKQLLNHSPEFRANNLGTMELRTWDTTFDMDLAVRRGAFLREFVEAAATGPTEEDIDWVGRNILTDRLSYAFSQITAGELTREVVELLYVANPNLRATAEHYPVLREESFL